MKKRYDKELTTQELIDMPDKDIDYSDIPELDKNLWAKAEIRPPRKEGVYIKLDKDILEWLRGQGKGYQTKINAVLRSYYKAYHKDTPKP